MVIVAVVRSDYRTSNCLYNYLQIVGSLSKIIVTEWIKAQFFAYEFLMMHLLILEGVPLSNFNIHADKQNGCLAYAKLW